MLIFYFCNLLYSTNKKERECQTLGHRTLRKPMTSDFDGSLTTRPTEGVVNETSVTGNMLRKVFRDEHNWSFLTSNGPQFRRCRVGTFSRYTTPYVIVRCLVMFPGNYPICCRIQVP